MVLKRLLQRPRASARLAEAVADWREALRSGADARVVVVLVHGMNLHPAAMSLLRARFAGRGYETHSFPYLASEQSLCAIAARLRRFIAERARGRSYHLVAHSLGNVLIRRASSEGLPEGLGRIVMITPPNHPQLLARLAKNFSLYQRLTGDSGQRLADAAFYDELAVPAGEFGVIAGSRGQRLTFSEANDGIVAVSSTRLRGMKDFVILPYSHSLILLRSRTFDAARRFIEDGRFAYRRPSPALY